MPPPPTGSRTPLKNINAGFQTGTFYSGMVTQSLTCAPAGAFSVGSDTFLCSGPGRLDAIMVITPQTSGIPVIFYDAALPVSGGPIPASGHKVVGVIPATYNTPVGITPGSGQVAQASFIPGVQYMVSIPFNSGLCYNSRAAQPSFSVSFTPEPAGQ